MKKNIRIFLIATALFVITSITIAQQNKAEQLYQKAVFEMEGKGNYTKAIESFTLVMTKFPKEKATAAKALLNIGRCYEKLGKNEATKAYERILKEFKDQPQIVAEARTRLATLKQSTEEVMHQSQITNRQIWAGKDVDTEGAPSPDGQYLSYTDSKKNSLAIYNVKTGERKVLGNPGADRHMGVNESVWSPDSKQLAYGLIDEDHGIAEIQLVNFDGAIHRKLCSADPGNSYIWVEDWSKDGLTILAVFQNLDGSDSKIALVSVTDGSVRFVKTMSNWNWGLSHKLFFSPDGRFIAYSSPTEKKSKSCDVFVIAVDGTNEINITQHLDDDRVLGWNPDGSRLLFTSNRGGGYSIWAIPIVNGQPQEYPKLVKDNIGKISPMGLTSDGSLYYSVTSAKESNIYLASIDPQTGKIVSQPKAATMQNNGFNHSFAWSPDGKNLLYLSDFFRITNDNWNKTFMLTPETGLEKRVVSQIASDTVIAYNWFPDGKHLAVVGKFSDGSNGICKLNIQNGKLIPILTSKSKDTTYWFPSVSPDGKSIFTHTWLNNNQSIYSYDIEKREKKLLFQSGKDRYIYSVRLSPDGKQLAFILMTIRPEEFPALMTMSSSGGEATAIYRNNIPGQFGNFAWYYGLDWSPDGQYIYFAKRPDSVSPYELLRVPVQGGSLEQTGVEMEGLHCISIRPDGKQIAFSAGADPKQEIWVLENIFADARTQRTKLNGPTTRSILTDASDVYGSLTNNGKYISHIDGNTGDMVQFEIASGQTTRIKNVGGPEAKEEPYEYQAFARDGKQIAYDSYSKDNIPQLKIRNLDGSGLRILYSEKSYDARPLDWSPDAKYILVLREQDDNPLGGVDLSLISTKDGSVHVLKSIPSYWVWALFSPDGRYIAFNYSSEGSRPKSDLHIMTTNGENEIIVAGHSSEDRFIGWTPDGKSLLFKSDRSGIWDLWKVNIALGKQEGEPELIKKDFNLHSEIFGISPNGSLYYKINTSSGQLYEGEIDLETGKLIVVPTPIEKRYTSPVIQMSWSPNGKYLAYLSLPGNFTRGGNVLTIRSDSTGEERFLSPHLRGINQISWSPDSRSIIALGWTVTGTGIFKIDIEKNEVTKLTEKGVVPRLCADGKTILYWDGVGSIVKRNLESGEESKVVTMGLPFYDISPDGKEIVFKNDLDGVIKIKSINDGETRELIKGHDAQLTFLKWTRDGRYILAKWGKEIWRIPANGGTPLRLDFTIDKIPSLQIQPGNDIPRMSTFAIHPDNRHFAVGVREELKSELWVMENFLPKEKE